MCVRCAAYVRCAYVRMCFQKLYIYVYIYIYLTHTHTNTHTHAPSCTTQLRIGYFARHLIPAVDVPSGGNKNIVEFRVDASLDDDMYAKLNKMGGGKGKKGKKGKKKCDATLKEDVVQVRGRGDNSRPAVYEFRYKGSYERERGLMAQELLCDERWRNAVSVEMDEEDGLHLEVDVEFVDLATK